MAEHQIWNEIELNNSRWQYPLRYKNLCPLGQGAYGLVWYFIIAYA
jgi:hypothetical protein